MASHIAPIPKKNLDRPLLPDMEGKLSIQRVQWPMFASWDGSPQFKIEGLIYPANGGDEVKMSEFIPYPAQPYVDAKGGPALWFDKGAKVAKDDDGNEIPVGRAAWRTDATFKGFGIEPEDNGNGNVTYDPMVLEGASTNVKVTTETFNRKDGSSGSKNKFEYKPPQGARAATSKAKGGRTKRTRRG